MVLAGVDSFLSGLTRHVDKVSPKVLMEMSNLIKDMRAYRDSIAHDQAQLAEFDGTYYTR